MLLDDLLYGGVGTPEAWLPCEIVGSRGVRQQNSMQAEATSLLGRQEHACSPRVQCNVRAAGRFQWWP